jgi:hypothetical protein
MRFSLRFVLGGLALLTACGGTGNPGFEAGNGGVTNGTGGAGGAGGSLGGTDGGLGGDGSLGNGKGSGDPGCPAQTQFIYVVTADETLYKFDPPTRAFTTIGQLNCPGGFATPYSMAVDRRGTAWVLYTDGHLYRVDTSNASCAATSFAPGQHGFRTFGMGYATNTPGGTDETLFVGDSGQRPDDSYGPTKGLATIDTTTLALTPIASYDALSARAEMTGTGDARLFGAFEGSPYVVAEIDKRSAKILSQAPQSAINYPPTMSNFAFAFWGGDFFLFVGPGTSTDVFQYRPSTKATTTLKTVNFEIVGAGVSTCAPTQPPK